MRSGRLEGGLAVAALLAVAAGSLRAQEPPEPEVLQLVTFHFLPGRASEALAIYRDEALPLYERDEPMLWFRALREVESPEPLDLVVVSAFRGMAGMDASNERLRAEAERAGTSIGALYGRIGALSRSHHDRFVEMLAPLDHGDPFGERLVALISYRVAPGEAEAFEHTLAARLLPAERAAGVPSRTGRFLVSDGWHYLRIVGVESLGAYQAYWSGSAPRAAHRALEPLTALRKEAILAPVPELAAR